MSKRLALKRHKLVVLVITGVFFSVPLGAISNEGWAMTLIEPQHVFFGVQHSLLLMSPLGKLFDKQFHGLGDSSLVVSIWAIRDPKSQARQC